MPTHLGKRVGELRQKAGLTLDDLGGKIGKTHSHIWNIENSLSFSPKVKQVEELADALDTTLSYLLCIDDVSEASASDTAFIRKYKKMNNRGKKKLRNILDVLSTED